MPFAMVSPSRPGNAQLLPPYADSQGIGIAPTATNPPPSAVPAGFHALPGRERPVQVPHHRQPQQTSHPPFAGGGHPPVGEDVHTLYRMQPILNSPGNMRRLPAQVPLQPQQQHFAAPHATPQPATPFDKATGKTINSIVEIRRLEHVIGDMFHAGTTQVTGYPSPDPQLAVAPPRNATRPPVEQNHLQHPESAVFECERPRHSSPHLRAHSPQALRYDSPRHGSPPSSPHLRRIPSPPGVGYPAASPRRMEALAAEWQAHASDLESRLARHAHNLAESKAAAERNASILAAHTSPQRYDPWSGGAGAGANPHAAPPSVHTDDLEDAIGLDAVQHLAVDEHNKRREGAGGGGAPVRFDVLCKELAQEAAEQMLAGAPAPSPETALGGQQGQFAFRPQAKVGPVEALQLALGDKGSEAQVLSPSLTHIGLGYASNATACVVVVNYSPKHSG